MQSPTKRAHTFLLLILTGRCGRNVSRKRIRPGLGGEAHLWRRGHTPSPGGEDAGGDAGGDAGATLMRIAAQNAIRVAFVSEAS